MLHDNLCDFEILGSNASYWCPGIEESVLPDSSVKYVGTYTPLASGFHHDKLGVVPQKPDAFR